MKPQNICVLLCVLFIAISGMAYPVWAAENRPPFVSNVHAEQRPGTKLVDITYDVDDPDGDMLTIAVAVSDDGGNTFTVPAKTFTGDVGAGIAPGKAKKIVWSAGVDTPNVFGVNYRVKITATDGKAGAPTITGSDGALMALIPAGEFQMGDAFNEGYSDERPVHKVYLDAFYIDVSEVTNAQYAKFLNEYGKETDPAGHTLIIIGSSMIEKAGNVYRPITGYESHPVVYVSWYGAAAYAQFYGKRLPTEAEWEKAARGGLVGKRYPWGNEITNDDANNLGTGGRDIWSGTSPVGSFAPNGYGLYDVAGNVWEWCADEYSSGYYGVSPKNNPKGPGISVTFINNDFTSVNTARVLRGGGWLNYAPFTLRVAYRGLDVPTSTYYDIGFRCAGL